jgi:hypothetical protein
VALMGWQRPRGKAPQDNEARADETAQRGNQELPSAAAYQVKPEQHGDDARHHTRESEQARVCACM